MMHETTYNWACPCCAVTIEDAVTVKHLERALLQHVGTEHPAYLGLARETGAKGLRPLALFDSVPTAEGETTTCRSCGATITIGPVDPEAPLLQSFKGEHVARHADELQEGRA
jgi:hypothetical protein